jgi:hypothetical protein
LFGTWSKKYGINLQLNQDFVFAHAITQLAATVEKQQSIYVLATSGVCAIKPFWTSNLHLDILHNGQKLSQLFTAIIY